jgi:ribosomal protein S18 acetylase RimI-like enzyme
MKDMIIRKATVNDYIAVSEIYEQSTKLHSNLEPGWIKENRPFGINQDVYVKLINDSKSTILVAVLQDVVVGFVEVLIKNELENDYFNEKNFAWVDDVAVRDNARGIGVGRKLMEAAEQWARIKKVDSIELTTRVVNVGAIEFYKKLGYETYVVRSKKKLR